MKKGEVTAFLSLIFILLMSMIAAVVESASIQVMKNRRRGDMDRAIESVFAEYQREILEETDIFSLDGTYGTGEFREENIEERLVFYGIRDAGLQVEKIQFLTDESGRAFREQVIAYMKHRVGVSQMEELAEMTGAWKEQTGKSEQYEQEETDVGTRLEESLLEEEQTLPEKDNPIGIVASLKKAGLLQIVMKEQDISNQEIDVRDMLSHRSLHKGKGRFKIRADTEGMSSNLYFASYLLEKFCGADAPHKEGKLAYELEYILHGGNSDRENLESVLRKLSSIRLAANYAYLLTDGEKKAEAGAMAAALAGIVALPALTELLRQGILLAWSFGESVMDLRTLLAGGRIPLVKTRADWQLTLSGLLKLGTKEDTGAAAARKEGLNYKEYLRMLLIFEDPDVCTMRSLDVLEMRMKARLGEWFRADCCISKLCMRAKCRFRRNVFYEFVTEYGYQ